MFLWRSCDATLDFGDASLPRVGKDPREPLASGGLLDPRGSREAAALLAPKGHLASQACRDPRVNRVARARLG